MENVIAMILAGGRGKRMDLLCHLRPKPALPFAGKLHVIDFTLSNCVNSRIDKIAVLVDYQRDHMTRYLRKWDEDNLNSPGVLILQPNLGSYAGTADAVYRNLSFLDSNQVNKVLILAGDHVYRMNYQGMVCFHEKTGADVTVGVVQIPYEEAYRFGTVRVDRDNRILEFAEKSPSPLSNLASMGIYLFNKNTLIKQLTDDSFISSSVHDFGYSILPGIVKTDKVVAYQFTGYWQDIGTVIAYYQANMELLDMNPRFSLDGSWPVMSDYKALPVPEQNSDRRVINSVISPGCSIQGIVENSILSPGVNVEEQAVVRDSIVMANSSIGYHSVVQRSILDEGVHLGKYSFSGFGESLVSAESDITVIGKDVIVPETTAIGRNCRILPKVDLSSFKGCMVPAGTTISHTTKKSR